MCTCFACLSSLQIVAHPLHDHCKYTLIISFSFFLPLFLPYIYCPLFLLFVSPIGNRGWEQKQCTQSRIKHANACVCVRTVAGYEDQCMAPLCQVCGHCRLITFIYIFKKIRLSHLKCTELYFKSAHIWEYTLVVLQYTISDRVWYLQVYSLLCSRFLLMRAICFLKTISSPYLFPLVPRTYSFNRQHASYCCTFHDGCGRRRRH